MVANKECQKEISSPLVEYTTLYIRGLNNETIDTKCALYGITLWRNLLIYAISTALRNDESIDVALATVSNQSRCICALQLILAKKVISSRWFFPFFLRCTLHKIFISFSYKQKLTRNHTRTKKAVSKFFPKWKDLSRNLLYSIGTVEINVFDA